MSGYLPRPLIKELYIGKPYLGYYYLLIMVKEVLLDFFG
jgi:hypothetical protein